MLGNCKRNLKQKKLNNEANFEHITFGLWEFAGFTLLERKVIVIAGVEGCQIRMYETDHDAFTPPLHCAS